MSQPAISQQFQFIAQQQALQQQQQQQQQQALQQQQQQQALQQQQQQQQQQALQQQQQALQQQQQQQQQQVFQQQQQTQSATSSSSSSSLGQNKGSFLKTFLTVSGDQLESFLTQSNIQVVKHQKAIKKNTGFKDMLKKISTQEEVVLDMKDALAKLSDSITATETQRSALVDRLHVGLLNRTIDLTESNKNQKKLLADRTRQWHAFISKKSAYENARRDMRIASEDRLRRLLAEAKDEEKKLIELEKLMNKSVLDFQTDRIKTVKAMLDDFIQAQLWFYSKQMENLSAVYKSIQSVDPDRGRKVMERTLEIFDLEERKNNAIV
eukprot:TRINITY_DN943_c0_g1_i1.p1 TRINITY_DN943_c0_g1~~TRINITY_DN943_c0_g1_i1.p1  ORF type:complete len:324 (+),score=119.84 TRINITY_DN943_c0_g1_i1:137-1108(+)